MENWEEILKPIVEEAIEVAKQTGEFVIEEAPLVLQEFYMWHTWSSIFWMVISLLTFLFFKYLPYLWLKEEYDGMKHEGKYFNRGSKHIEDTNTCWVILMIMGLVYIPMFVYNLYCLLKILISPRIYLIEYFLS